MERLAWIICAIPFSNSARLGQVPSGHSKVRVIRMIKKVSGGYSVLSEKGKNLGGPYKTKKEAERRLKQVEFFKHKKGG
jgi:hypothetical protein